MDVDLEIYKTRSLILKMHIWLAVIIALAPLLQNAAFGE